MEKSPGPESEKDMKVVLMQKQNLIGDSLGIGEKSLRESLEKGETIVLSFHMYKYNKSFKRQERNLLMTNKNLYNLADFGVITSALSFFSKAFPIKRKIPFDKIKAITYSIISSEFVVHIPDEFDLRYSCECRDEVLRALLENMGKLGIPSLPFYFKEEVELANYTTHRSEKKKGILRPPKGEKEDMDLAKFEKFWEKREKDKEFIKKNTNMVFTRDNKNDQKVHLDDFELLRVIGRGGFGKVYLAEMRSNGCLYAIKSIKKTLIIEKAQLDNIKRERDILQRATHPFIVGLEFAFQTPERIYFVMRFIQGGELFVLLRREKKFDEKRAKFYVAQITMAIEYLHSNGVIYRDLKPENILLDEEGYLKITDFGASKIVTSGENTTKTFIGTADYIAPEILQRKGHGMEVDWWSLGILTFEMMVGIPPFYHKNHSVMFKWIVNEDPIFPLNCTISQEARSFILALLKKEPKERITGPDIRKHPWMKDIDFEKIYKKEIPATFKPKISSEFSVENFYDQFTKEEVRDTIIDKKDMERIKR